MVDVGFSLLPGAYTLLLLLLLLMLPSRQMYCLEASLHKMLFADFQAGCTAEQITCSILSMHVTRTLLPMHVTWGCAGQLVQM